MDRFDTELLDLQYEFDAPRWFDFRSLQAEPIDSENECFDNDMDESDEFAKNDYWFEVEHPYVSCEEATSHTSLPFTSQLTNSYVGHTDYILKNVKHCNLFP